MKRKLAWLLSAAMMFSSVPAGSINVLAASTQQEASSQAEEELTVQEEAETASEQTIQTEDFEESADIIEGTDIEEPIPGDAEELSEDAQEITADSDFSDGEEAAAEESSTEESEEIHLGENILDIASGMNYTWKFTAQEESTYKFHASSGMSFYMNISDDYNYADGDSDENGQFVEWYLEENETCYIEIEVDDENDDSGQLKLVVKKICDTHVPLAGSEVVTQPTCEEEGYTTYTCQVCGEKYKDNYVDPTGHQFEQTGKQEPTCEETGYTTYTCKICGYDYTDDYIDSLGHQYTITDRQDATCTESGYVQYTCKICGNEYEEYLSAYHQLDESGVCTVCQTESPYKIMNAELTEDDADTVGFEYEYDGEEDCQAYIEIYDEESDELVFKEYTDIAPSENKGEIYVGINWPKYYIIKAYLSENGHVISNTYVNLFHTKAFDNLDNYVPDYKDDHTVDLSEGNYGVFAEDTVVIHGNASENTLTDMSMDSNTYTLVNTNSRAHSIVQDCNLAYFYDNELKLVVHVNKVTWPSDKTVSFTVSQPALEQVFKYLKIDSVVQNQACTVDLSGLPQGVSYGRARTVASAFKTQGAMVTETTLSSSQNYSFNALKINNSTEINGDISVDMKFPVKLYITESKQMIQFGVETALNGSVSVKGGGALSVPLGEYYVPLMNGILYLRTRPGFKLSADGSVSLKFGSEGSIQMQQDYYTGFQILSKEFKNDNFQVEVEGDFLVGLEIKPELFLLPKNKLLTASLSLGPQISATLTTPIPIEEQVKGDHSCQSCLEGEGNLIAELEAKITAFKKEAKSTTTFKLKGLEFYYSFDHITGGRGTCPYKNGEADPKDKNDLDYGLEGHGDGDKDYVYLYGNEYRCEFYRDDFTCVILGVDSENETVTLPSIINRYEEDYETVFSYRVIGYRGEENKGVASTKHLIIPESIKSFTNLGYSFPYMESVEFSGERKLICDEAFAGCKKLKRVEIPYGVISVGDCAFYNCSSLTEIEIPDSVKYIGAPVFVNCTSLKRIKVGKNVDHVGHLEAMQPLYGDYQYDSYAKEFILSEGIKFIEALAFEGYSNLTHIKIPDSVKYIGKEAFWNCENLKEISIPDGVKIGTYAFLFCSSLQYVRLPGDMKEIKSGIFSGCNSLKNITLPDSITVIGSHAFYGCVSLESIKLPEGTKTIGEETFGECKALRNIDIPDSVKSIGKQAFEYSGLEKIVLSDNIETIGDNVFLECNLKEMTIDKNVKINFSNTGRHDAGWGGTVETVYLTEGREEIPDGSIFGGVKKVVLPNSLKRIGKSAFESCVDLEEINLPEGLEEIGEDAFKGCLALSSIVIPDSVKTIGDNAFDCGNIKEVTIGKGVDSGDFEKWGCIYVNTIHLPEGIEEIKDNQFVYLLSLKSIEIPDSVRRIGNNAFAWCCDLEEISLPKGLKEIGECAFLRCNLTSVTIPASVEKVGNEAFSGCFDLNKVIIAGKDTIITSWSDFHLKTEDPDMKIYGLTGSVAEKTVYYGLNFIALEKIDEEGHGYVTDHVITPSTCSTPGEYVLKCVLCENCGKTCTAEMPLSDEHEKIEKTSLVQASIGSPGKTAGSYCKACGKTVEEGETIPAIKTITLSKTSYSYNGKVQKPTVTVKDSAGNKLSSGSYSVIYDSGCTNAGTYNVKVNFKGNYKGSKSLSYRITPATQKMTVKTSAKTYSYTTAKAQTFSIGASAKTPVSYKSSNTKYVTVDKKGKVTVKKGSPWGTYTVTATAAKNKNYSGAAKTITIKINPLTQSVKAKVSSKTYKYAAVKKGKQTFSIGASAKTTLSYSSSNTKYVTVNKKGAVTVKKGTPKGTYKITVKAAKSAGYAEAKKVITIKIS